ncbi:MAG TPA: methyltransferase domain-containing protein [Anaerolineae bacterium]|nr:methyltransferase domain-containing protein [Anaerolineae bacterium]
MTQAKEQIKQLLGTVMLPFMPARAERLAQESFSMTTGGRDFVDACLRAGLARKLLSQNKEAEIAEYHRKFWEKNNSLEYHRGVRDMVMQVFHDYFEFLIPEIKTLLAENPDFKTLIEIGSGGGDLLNYLAEQIGQLDTFVGIDLSPEITEENKSHYRNAKLRWIADNGKIWVEENGQPNNIFMTFRGVLEYFTTTDLEEMFGRIATSMQPSIFILVEPIALTHDLATDVASHPYGTEYTFSHNYPHLLKQAGFDLRLNKLETFDDHHLCAIIATVGI